MLWFLLWIQTIQLLCPSVLIIRWKNSSEFIQCWPYHSRQDPHWGLLIAVVVIVLGHQVKTFEVKQNSSLNVYWDGINIDG